jgi:hypothetical protein
MGKYNLDYTGKPYANPYSIINTSLSMNGGKRKKIKKSKKRKRYTKHNRTKRRY